MAYLSFALPACSKLTRTGFRCPSGAGYAESGAVSSASPSLGSAFFITGLCRLNSATLAKIFFPSPETPQ